jgi:hypothetical protein
METAKNVRLADLERHLVITIHSQDKINTSIRRTHVALRSLHLVAEVRIHGQHKSANEDTSVERHGVKINLALDSLRRASGHRHRLCAVSS